MKRDIVLGIPLYHPGSPVVASIEKCDLDGIERNIRCVFVVDAHTDGAPIEQSASVAQSLHQRFSTTIIKNDRNPGFAGAANKILEFAAREHLDVILLSSDIVLYPETLKEMIFVADSDPMIGLVGALSNDAAICHLTLPGADPDSAYQQFVAIRRRLPQKSYVPTARGGCWYIKWAVLAEFGLLDETCEEMDDIEDDFTFRANRHGYSSALANWAFAFRADQADDASGRATIGEGKPKSSPVLNQRYPEYGPAISAYERSADCLALQLLSNLAQTQGRYRIAFDCSSWRPFFNGTYEYGRAVMLAFSRAFGDKYSITICCTREVWKFHRLDVMGAERCDAGADRKFAAVVLLGQPFDVRSMKMPFENGAVTIVVMLDTIAQDSLYLRTQFPLLPVLWNFVAKWATAIVFISQFSRTQFVDRFEVSAEVNKVVSLPSTNVGDYLAWEPDVKRKSDYFLIVGNWYHHKYVRRTVERLRTQLSGVHLKVLGMELPAFPEVTSIISGGVEGSRVNSLYHDAAAVIFPSHYEGFGLPVMHALANKTPVFARDLPVYREIMEQTESRRNIHLFATTDELIERLRMGPPRWVDDEGARNNDHGWLSAATGFEQALQSALDNLGFKQLTARLADFELFQKAVHAMELEGAGWKIGDAARIMNSRSKLALHLLKLIGKKK
jgi:GT2 family glycosyltransferase/glycosyltransferase involved in cell wall biosynthesis